MTPDEELQRRSGCDDPQEAVQLIFDQLLTARYGEDFDIRHLSDAEGLAIYREAEIEYVNRMADLEDWAS